MRYNPPDEETTSEENPETYFEGRPRYISDQTAFMRWSTEIEPSDHIVDEDFMERNKHRIMDINKILPLSFIDNPKSIKLFRLRRMNMGLAKDAGLEDLVDETILDNLADYQTTRGIRGNYQNALITQKREWQDRTEKEKRGMLSKFFRNKSEEESIKESLGEVY